LSEFEFLLQVLIDGVVEWTGNNEEEVNKMNILTFAEYVRQMGQYVENDVEHTYLN
jgi:hypothetical protein